MCYSYIDSMSKEDLLNEIVSINKKIGVLNTKIDKLVQKQILLEKKFDDLDNIQKSITTLPVKLNTTTYQIISQLREEVNDISSEFEEKISDTIGKLESLVNVNKRLDQFEENSKAYIEKMRYMLIEMEDMIKEECKGEK